MEYKDDQEIEKIVKYINEINEQINSPNEGIRDLLTRIQNDYKIESKTMELISANMDSSKLTTAENIDINVLYSKLPLYKTFFTQKLVSKINENEKKNNNI